MGRRGKREEKSWWGGGTTHLHPLSRGQVLPNPFNRSLFTGYFMCTFADGNNNCMASGENLLASLFAIDTDAQ